MNNRKLILYIAASLDGFIAKPGDDLSFLDAVQKEGEDYGYAAFTSQVDTVIMGRKTFDWVFKVLNDVPHPEKETFIITRTAREPIGRTQFFTGDVVELLRGLKAKPGGVIYCDGGAQLANTLYKAGLLDEIIISVIPVLLGGGVRLFQEGIPERQLELVGSKAYESGMVQVHYRVG
ncbi:MAG: dihydrofolate reductase family protein [Saprospiraceae bacterium]|nr:dihydrofolate reductase family protein [Saprospiraceae bacterium]